MKVIVVLAMHGVPPSDFPRQETAELFGLHMRLEQGDVPEPQRAAMSQRFADLDAKMRAWPRNEQNDRFYVASQRLAQELERATGYEVIVGFNEFCAPKIEQALDEAVGRGAARVVVITPMMTPGGEHSDEDIPAQIEATRQRHKDVEFAYAWPYEMSDVANFLSAQVKRYV